MESDLNGIDDEAGEEEDKAERYDHSRSWNRHRPGVLGLCRGRKSGDSDTCLV